MTQTEPIYRSAELALAAYADLVPGLTITNKQALVNGGMSSKQVELKLAPIYFADFSMQRVGVKLRTPRTHELPVARIPASLIHGNPQAARMTRAMVAR